jgi:hypothetical protein
MVARRRASIGSGATAPSKPAGDQLHLVEAELARALFRLALFERWPRSHKAARWLAEARLYRRQARRRFVPCMQPRIDLAGLHADALAGLPDTIDGQAPLPVPETCPVTLDELLGEDPIRGVRR